MASPSRRTLLRRLGGSAALGTLALGSGCSALPPLYSGSRTRGGSVTESDALSSDEFDGYTRRMLGRYSEAGVWGLGSAPDGAAFVGAWTLKNDVRARGDDGPAVATADFALACYRLGVRGEDDEQHYRYWLWGAAAPERGARVDVPLGRRRVDISIRGLGVHVAFGGDDELLMYAPGGDRKRAGVVDVAFGTPDGDPVAGGFRLHDGTVSPSYPKTWDGHGHDVGTGQTEDEYTVGWQGRYGDVQSVNALCFTRRPTDAPPEAVSLSWNGHVAVSGSL